MDEPSAVTFEGLNPTLARLLPDVACRIFSATFADRYEGEPFAAFCTAAYGPGGAMEQDFGDPTVRWRIAVNRGAPIGYAKLTPLRTPFPSAQPDAMELQQIYVLHEWQGLGVADRLTEWAIETAQGQGAPELFLDVFDHNERARRFYARHGFSEVGRCTITLGDIVDGGRVYRRPLAQPA